MCRPLFHLSVFFANSASRYLCRKIFMAHCIIYKPGGIFLSSQIGDIAVSVDGAFVDGRLIAPAISPCSLSGSMPMEAVLRFSTSHRSSRTRCAHRAKHMPTSPSPSARMPPHIYSRPQSFKIKKKSPGYLFYSALELNHPFVYITKKQ